MSWDAHPVALPPRVVEVRAADLDGDGASEIVLVSRLPAPDGPDPVRLTVLHVGPDGAEEGRHTIDLGREPLLWEAEAGLWLQDARGLLRVDARTGERTRVVSLPTPLAGLGPATPQEADLLVSGVGDVPLLVAWLADGLAIHAPDGRPLGAFHDRPRGRLEFHGTQGGRAFAAGSLGPTITLGDVDGDGRADAILPRGARIDVRFATEEGFGPTRTTRLPLDLDPTPLEEERAGRRLVATFFEDLDGDGRTDLGVHQAVTDGGFFGATAAFTWFRGGPEGFRQAGVVRTEMASFEVRPLDPDGDGDRDLLSIQVDTGFTNLARALVARAVEVRAVLYPMDGGRYGEGRVVGTLTWPLAEGREVLWHYGDDLTGDGLADLVTNGAGDTLRLLPGTPEGIADAPLWERPLQAPPGARLTPLPDLPAPGRTGLLVWAPEGSTATLILTDP